MGPSLGQLGLDPSLGGSVSALLLPFTAWLLVLICAGGLATVRSQAGGEMSTEKC